MIEINFFSECKNDQDAKTVYRKLAKLFHPDITGNDEMMRKLQDQYESFKPNVSPSINGYTFNTIRGSTGFNQNVPFDHPLRQTIRDLENEIEIHKANYKTSKAYIDRLLFENDNLRKLQKLGLDLQVEIKEQARIICELQKITKQIPKTLSEHIKQWWSEL